MEITLEQAQAVLEAQPFSVLLGARLTAFSPGRAEIVVPLADQVRQQDGFAHGGLLSYAADNAVTFAAGSVAGPGVLTAQLTTSFTAPARGDELVARASVKHAGTRLIVASCQLYDRVEGIEHLCAVAQGSVMRTSPSQSRPNTEGAS